MHHDRIAKNCKFKVKVEPTSATFWLRFVQDKLRQKIAAFFDAEKLKSGHKDEFASFFSTPLFGVLKTILLQKKEFAAVMVAQLVEHPYKCRISVFRLLQKFELDSENW